MGSLSELDCGAILGVWVCGVLVRLGLSVNLGVVVCGADFRGGLVQEFEIVR